MGRTKLRSTAQALVQCGSTCVSVRFPITVSIKRNNSGGVRRRKTSRWSCPVINGVISCSNPCQNPHACTGESMHNTRAHETTHKGLLMAVNGRIQMRRADNCTKNTKCGVPGQRDIILSTACLFSQLSYFCRDKSWNKSSPNSGQFLIKSKVYLEFIPHLTQNLNIKPHRAGFTTLLISNPRPLYVYPISNIFTAYTLDCPLPASVVYAHMNTG